jgi:16S rRNA U516 pseudouridylate synthase RsuA-like enzyme
LLCEAAGLEIFSLKRIRLGPLHLGALPLGRYRPLTKKEIAEFLDPKEKKFESPSFHE